MAADHPIVAIVGRPNVGKSTLLNRLAGRRISIVHPMAGVTRDRVSALVEHGGVVFEAVDTGGIGVVDSQRLEAEIERQVQVAMDGAHLLLLVVDVTEGVVPLDREVARRARQAGRPVILVANKADTREREGLAAEFHELGMGEPMPVSALGGAGVPELLDRVVEVLPRKDPPPPREELLKLAVVGRRNAGKSSFVNALARGERVIVSEVPGTTRDAVDVVVEGEGGRLVVIDTAGMRRGNRYEDPVEFYGRHRTGQSIRRADVVVLVLDSTQEVSRTDKGLADQALSEFKPLIVFCNKWDLARGRMTPAEFSRYLGSELPGLGVSPVLYGSAREGTRVWETAARARDLHRQSGIRASTAEVNRVLSAAEAERHTPVRHSTTGRIYFASQIGMRPPTFVLFVNKPSLYTEEFRRYLAGRLRAAFPFREVPLRLIVRERRSLYDRVEPAREGAPRGTPGGGPRRKGQSATRSRARRRGKG
ncbi:MAG: ribosome biogenesis GTPase Der [Planctomycetes bacterium]|nr:ribosome biogenesis GTPase Der [Planctomycetota bacterium]